VLRWEWLSLLLDDNPLWPWIVWSGREVGIGKTGEYIEALIRLDGGEPDVLAAAYRASPSTNLPMKWKKPFWGLPWEDPRSASIE
jgi:hypothetical protein